MATNLQNLALTVVKVGVKSEENGYAVFTYGYPVMKVEVPPSLECMLINGVRFEITQEIVDAVAGR